MLSRSAKLHSILKQNITDFVNMLTRYGKQIDLNLVLKLCKISRSLFYYWKDLVFKECSTSSLKLCRKAYPNQLTTKETEAMKRLLTLDRFKYWPVCSVAWYALREKVLSCSLSTWYLYSKRFGILRCRIPKKRKYITGIIAGGPNEIWHADITIVKTKDNIKHYVYLLMDNFSRYVLNWRIETCVSAKIRVETVRDAYRKYIVSTKKVLLITDGDQRMITTK